MSETAVVKVYFLDFVEIPVNLVPTGTDAEAICEALITQPLPPDTTLIGYDVTRDPGTIETFYWDSDFQSTLSQGLFGPIFSLTQSLEELRATLASTEPTKA